MSQSRMELQAIMASLPESLQQQVVDYARFLLESDAAKSAGKPKFYICPVCFEAAEERLRCHDHLMVPCNAERKEDCRPVIDADGRLKSPAPRWFASLLSA